jgi:carbon monoxide dehydrogenase subunit G
MDISGDFSFEVPQQMVWTVLQDPKALGTILPMAMDMKQIGENQYTGSLFFRVGSIAGTFHGKIELFNIQAPNSYDIKVRGSSSVGEVNINGGMSLQSQDNRTTMHYHGNVHFGGRVASVGSRLLEVSVRSIVQQSFETLSRYLTVKYKNS